MVGEYWVNIETTGARMTAAAKAYAGALDGYQRARGMSAFDDEAARTSWAYFPPAHGLFIGDMDPRQQHLAHELLASALSVHAYAQTTTIMSLERLVHLIFGGPVRDPRYYAMMVFGSPGATPWGWRFEGHHVVFNFTLDGERVISTTPLFLGAQPALVTHGDVVVVRPCAEEEDAARALLVALDDSQRSLAVLTDAVPPDFVLANAPRVPDHADAGPLHPLPHVRARYDHLSEDGRAALRFERSRPAGIAASSMTLTQRALLDRLIAVYIERLPTDLATDATQRLKEEGMDGVHFAWAGAAEPGMPHYYRLQGSAFLVEYDVTQEDANHVHTVWRDAANDFGYDTLRHHLAQEHQVRTTM